MSELQYSQVDHAVFLTTGHSDPVPPQRVLTQQPGSLRITWKNGGLLVAGVVAAVLIVGMLVAVQLASQQQRVETKAYGVR